MVRNCKHADNKAWHLLMKASAVGEEAKSSEGGGNVEAVASHPTGAVARMETAANFFKPYLEGGNLRPEKQTDEV